MLQPRTLAPGEVIREPGLYRDVPMSLYHSGELCDGPSISSSGLRTIFTRSPAHFWRDCPQNPKRAEPKESAAFALGRALHHKLLGEADFGRHFAIRPAKWDSWRTKDAQEWKQAQLDNLKTVLTPEHLEVIESVRNSLAENPLVQAGILNGHIEMTLATKDSETGVWLLARPDVIPSDSGDVADFKSTISVALEDLERSVSEYRYDMQAGVVRRCMREVLKLEMTSFSLVWAEKTAPFCTQVTQIGGSHVDDEGHEHDVLDAAEADVQTALRIYAHCLRSGRWPGPGGTQHDALTVGLSPWSRRRADARRAFLEMELAA